MEDNDNFSGFFTKIPSHIALISTLLLALSIVHELFYFWIVGPGFIEFISASDYLVLALDWSPAVLVGMIISFIPNIPTLLYKIKPTFSTSFKILNTIPYFLIFITCLIYQFFGTIDFRGTNFSLITSAIWTFIIIYTVLRNKITLDFRKLGRFTFVFIVYFPLCLFVSAGTGFDSAVKDISSTTATHELLLKDSKLRNIIIIRNINRGLIYKNLQDNRIEFVEWSNVLQISGNTIFVDRRSYSCIYLSINCR